MRVRNHYDEVPLTFYQDYHSTTSAVGDVSVALGNGLTIGATVDEVRAAGPDGEFTVAEDKTPGLWFSFEPVSVTENDQEVRAWMRLQVDTGTGLVSEIYN